MLGWVRSKIGEAFAKRQLNAEMKFAIKAITKAGGADRVVFDFLDGFFASEDEKHDEILRMLRSRKGLSAARAILTTAAINSILGARRDLRGSPEDEKARDRLLLAEKAFLLSWHLTNGSLAEIAQPANLDNSAAYAALEKWLTVDDEFIDKWPFHVPI